MAVCQVFNKTAGILAFFRQKYGFAAATAVLRALNVRGSSEKFTKMLPRFYRLFVSGVQACDCVRLRLSE